MAQRFAEARLPVCMARPTLQGKQEVLEQQPQRLSRTQASSAHWPRLSEPAPRFRGAGTSTSCNYNVTIMRPRCVGGTRPPAPLSSAQRGAKSKRLSKDTHSAAAPLAARLAVVGWALGTGALMPPSIAPRMLRCPGDTSASSPRSSGLSQVRDCLLERGHFPGEGWPSPR